MVRASLSGVRFRNHMPYKMKNVQVVFAESRKSTGLLAYTFDWSTVDIEGGNQISARHDIDVGSVEPNGQETVDKTIPFDDDHRGYWQVYFWMEGKKYCINKNNAQCNPWAVDGGSYAEITVREEMPGHNIRVDFVMTSGNAYFYCHTC